MKMINYLFNVEKFVKNEALFVQPLNECFQFKKIVYQAKKNSVFGHYLYQFDLK